MAKRKQRVLVIDDEVRILNFLKIKLRLAGYDVSTAVNGQEGLDLIRSIGPDVIVLDLLMPVRDGFDVLKELRTFSNTPVIVLSARSDDFAHRVSTAIGANDTLGKPFNPDELVTRVSRLLGNSVEVA